MRARWAARKTKGKAIQQPEPIRPQPRQVRGPGALRAKYWQELLGPELTERLIREAHATRLSLVITVLIATLTVTGCGYRAQGPNVTMFVGKECKASAVMTGCDPKPNPPKCKTIQLRYDNDNCAKIVVSK